MDGDRTETVTATGALMMTLLAENAALKAERLNLTVELEIARQEIGRLRQQLPAAGMTE